MKRLVSKADWLAKIKELLPGYEVIGPQELMHKGIFYQPLKQVEDLYLGDGFATEPLKKYFLSVPGLIYAEKVDAGKVRLEPGSPNLNQRVIIGPRPCEARGLTLLDKVFLTESSFQDEYYGQERQRTVIVGFSCAKPDYACFCTSCGGSPSDNRGMDVLVFSAGDQYLLEIMTAKGQELFGLCGKELEPERAVTWEQEKKKLGEGIKNKFSLPALAEMDQAYSSDYWDKAALSCLSCGVCTYLCPTCHCFDLVDDARKRLRCYDSCAFADFTMEASGENPRPSKKERYRQRVYHKFNYFQKNYGENLCVGCGRCIRFCPVKIDITRIITQVNHK